MLKERFRVLVSGVPRHVRRVLPTLGQGCKCFMVINELNESALSTTVGSVCILHPQLAVFQVNECCCRAVFVSAGNKRQGVVNELEVLVGSGTFSLLPVGDTLCLVLSLRGLLLF